MAPKLAFAEGEKVLCYHGPLIYEAKCLKSSISKDKLVRYFIHYAGWNKNWDEWVPEDRVLKYNDENVRLQLELQLLHLNTNNPPAKTKKTTAKGRKSEANNDEARTSTGKDVEAGGASASKTNKSHKDTPDTDQPRKKRGRIELSTEIEEPTNLPEVKLKIPYELKLWLAADYNLVLNQHKLAILPAKLTVQQIFDNYIAYKNILKINNTPQDTVTLEVITGIKDYFNVSLGTHLLYEFERAQFEEISQSYLDTPMYQIYGAIHLIRFFIRFGKMLAYSCLDDNTLGYVVASVQDIMKYLDVNRPAIVNVQDYESAAPDYNRKS